MSERRPCDAARAGGRAAAAQAVSMLFGRAALLCTNILVMIDQLPVDRPPGLGLGPQACSLEIILKL